MSKFEIKPFTPKTAVEKRLADPTYIQPIEVHQAKAKSIHGLIAGVEDSLGLRFGCDVDQWNTPLKADETDPSDKLETAYKKEASTVGELHVVVDELTIASARAIFTLPINIPGHRKKAVVGTFEYMPVEGEIDGATGLLLLRKQIGRIQNAAVNPYFTVATAPADPSLIPGAGWGAQLNNQGYVGGNRL